MSGGAQLTFERGGSDQMIGLVGDEGDLMARAALIPGDVLF